MSSLSGKIVVVQSSPPEPQKSNIGPITRCTGGVAFVIAVTVTCLSG